MAVVHVAVITIMDEKFQQGILEVPMIPEDSNGDPVSIPVCLEKAVALANGLVSGVNPLILGQIVSVYLRVYADLADVTDNPVAPTAGSDVEECARIMARTAGGFRKTWTIPTTNEVNLTGPGMIHFDSWENYLLDLANYAGGGVGWPSSSDSRGDIIEAGTAIGIETFRKRFRR